MVRSYLHQNYQDFPPDIPYFPNKNGYSCRQFYPYTHKTGIPKDVFTTIAGVPLLNTKYILPPLDGNNIGFACHFQDPEYKVEYNLNRMLIKCMQKEVNFKLIEHSFKSITSYNYTPDVDPLMTRKVSIIVDSYLRNNPRLFENYGLLTKIDKEMMKITIETRNPIMLHAISCLQFKYQCISDNNYITGLPNDQRDLYLKRLYVTIFDVTMQDLNRNVTYDENYKKNQQ